MRKETMMMLAFFHAAMPFSQSAVSADRGPLSGMTALSSPLGPLPAGPGYDAPPASQRMRPDARRLDQGPADTRSADERRNNLRHEDPQNTAQEVRSANRAAAIDEAVTRDPRLSAGARVQNEAAAGMAGPIGGGRVGTGSGNAGLSGGSVFGGVGATSGGGSGR